MISVALSAASLCLAALSTFSAAFAAPLPDAENQRALRPYRASHGVLANSHLGRWTSHQMSRQHRHGKIRTIQLDCPGAYPAQGIDGTYLARYIREPAGRDCTIRRGSQKYCSWLHHFIGPHLTSLNKGFECRPAIAHRAIFADT